MKNVYFKEQRTTAVSLLVTVFVIRRLSSTEHIFLLRVKFWQKIANTLRTDRINIYQIP